MLARVAGEELSAFYQRNHHDHGVDLQTNVAVDSLVDDGIAVTGVKLTDSTVLAAESVIVGIGIIPDVAPLILAGASGANSVM